MNKENTQRANEHGKDAQPHQPLGKCKLKPMRDAPARKANSKREQQSLARTWGNWDPQAWLAGMQNSAFTLEKRTAVFYIVKLTPVTGPSNSTARRNKHTLADKDLRSHVYSSFMHNGPKVNNTKVHRRMDV